MKTHFDDLFSGIQEIKDYIIRKYKEGYFEDDITKLLMDNYYIEKSNYDQVNDYVHNTITSCTVVKDARQKAIELVNAYFDKKDIIVKDSYHGIHNWISIKHPEIWTYLGEFCKNVDKYKIINEN